MKIDLGTKSPAGCCSPASDKDEGEEKTYYPSLYFTGDEKMDIPDEGSAVITFRKVDSGENTRDPKEPLYRCEIEVHSIDVREGKKDDALKVSVGTALGEAMKKKKSAKGDQSYQD